MMFTRQAIIKGLLPFLVHTSAMGAAAIEQNPLKDRFNLASVPADLPSYDSGLNGQQIQMPFSQVIKSVGQNADLIMIGDTNHKDAGIRGLAVTRDNMVAMAESGISHLYVEIDQKLQPLAEKLIENKNDPHALAEFGREFNKDYGDATGNDNGIYTRQLAETILTGDKLGIKVHFANPGNGWKEYGEAERYANENPNDAQGIEQRLKLGRDARFDDKQLAGFINETSRGEKSAMIYGSSHASRFGDFENSYDGRAVKVDVYNNPQQYQEKMDIDKEALALNGMKFNEDKPELVYFKESQTAAMTYNTPPEMSQNLRDNGAVPIQPDNNPVPQPREQKYNQSPAV
ncbi:MAG: hypothetical protein JWO78_1562 [Micavibrio sp.]|nr:hypothetical protein [Micavibrio sp.]